MEKDEFIEIAGKVADGIADEKETALYNRYFNLYQLNDPEWDKVKEEDKENVLSELQNRIYTQIGYKPVVKYRFLWPKIAFAAAAVFILGIGILYQRQLNTTKGDIQANVAVPGKNEATLILSDGKKIFLAANLNGEVAKEQGVAVAKTADGEITYKTITNKAVAEAHSNTLRTGRGQTYAVRLPDGSKVWLNAASSLTYLVSAGVKNIRKVALTGEAYFEVAKDKMHPFVVQSAGQELEVLGTHFNVSNYSDENSVKTTVVEGAVKINKHTVVKPGEQSIVTKEGIKVIKVNAEDYIDWKDGIFNFENETMDAILLKISRWYNVDIDYKTTFDPTKTFSGTVSKKKSILEVLKTLQFSEGFKFTVEGNRLVVRK